MTPVSGSNLRLRLIEETDSAYVHALRINPAYNMHLSAVAGDVADHAAWIQAYKTRKAAGQEYYFIIDRHDGTRCGTVRLYDILCDTCTWGSWILDQNKTRKAALENVFLSFEFGFLGIDLSKALVDGHAGNCHALEFSQRLGVIELRQDDQDISFTYPRSRFEADRSAFLSILQQEAQP